MQQSLQDGVLKPGDQLPDGYCSFPSDAAPQCDSKPITIPDEYPNQIPIPTPSGLPDPTPTPSPTDGASPPTASGGNSSPSPSLSGGSGEESEPNLAELESNVQTIATKLDRSVKEIRDAIHQVKRSAPELSAGIKKNPDVRVNIKTGEVYPEVDKGKVSSDSIGNIFDYLP